MKSRPLHRPFLATLCLLSLFTLHSSASPAQITSLESAFRNPPPSARPWVYWFIMDGNFSRDGITADLEAMQRAGIGGAILLEVDVGMPKGPVKFMSPEWRELFKHAVNEAKRLGLEITLITGPGWTGSGGPWVKPEESMQHLVGSVTEIEGAQKFDGVLPRPPPRDPYFGADGLPEEFLKQHRGWFEDVAVLAFPTPESGDAARIDNILEKALYLRHPYSSGGAVNAELPMPAAFSATPASAAIPARAVVDLTSRMKPDGSLTWDAPPGKWTILRLVRVSTGANTRPAPAPGVGFESNKMDRAALDAHFETFVGSLLRTLGAPPQKDGAGWTMLHIDSWEMGAQNWTATFRAEFQKRRGYDPLTYLPAYLGYITENREITERFLWDMRTTAQELVVENHTQHLRDLGRKHGFQLSIEPYDMNPASDMDLGAAADVPMCEFWAVGDCFDTAFSCIEATSIAHTNGKKIVAAEAFTSGGDLPWQRYPGNMKNQADWALATGINRFAFHRFAHQPWVNAAPGMTMTRYGTQYDRTQTWWELSGAWHTYLARCQHMLRQGLPVADILYLVPEGAPNVFRAPASAFANSELLPDRRGHNFDGITPTVVLRDLSAKNERLTLPDGMSYRILVLPERETMTPALLRKIKTLIESGATVIGPRPKKSPSLVNYPACDAEVQKLAAELWGSETPTATTATSVERRIGKGRLIGTPYQFKPGTRPTTAPKGTTLLVPERRATFDAPYMPYDDVAAVLAKDGAAPDFESGQPLRYIHRALDDCDVYFVSNITDKPLDMICSFRVGKSSTRTAEIWDPVTGETRPLGIIPGGHAGRADQDDATTAAALQFAPHQSCFVVFKKIAPKTTDTEGSVTTPSVMRPLTTLDGPWTLSFPGGSGAPAAAVTLPAPTSWTEHADSGVRYFSGIATYEKTFTLTAAQISAAKIAGGGSPLYLDLGRVEVMAEVTLNGETLGTVWTAPYRVDISCAVRAGENTLRIRVANLWPNRMIGDATLPPDTDRVPEGWGIGVAKSWPQWLLDGKQSPTGRHQWSAFDPFTAQSPLLPSGLIGPVKILQTVPPL